MVNFLRCFILSYCLVAFYSVQASDYKLSLGDAIQLAQNNSVDALMAKHTYLSQYWQFRSYKAQMLPSFSLSGTLPNFDRSLTALQDAETGEYHYVENFAMRNNLGLYIQQNIAVTGGNIQLYTGLERLDQYEPSRRTTYNSAPVSLILNQPIGAFNSLKWDKKIEPVRYEKAKYEYLESLESIASNAVIYFFAQLIAQQNLMLAERNYANTDTLYKISKERFKIGSISNNDLMQLEVRLLNEEMTINSNKLQLDLTKAKLKSYLGFGEQEEVGLDIPDYLTAAWVDMEEVYRLASSNTSFEYQQKIQQLEAEKSVAEARANRRPQFNVYARFGLNQVAGSLGNAYKDPLDQETVRLGVSIPIFDGGVAKGRLRMALSKQEVVEAQIRKDEEDRKQDLYLKVMQFNNQSQQCAISAKVDSVARLRYQVALDQFAAGKISVLDFNTAQTEQNTAHNNYISELQNFWNYYYTLQRYTLYDFVRRQNIVETFDATWLTR